MREVDEVLLAISHMWSPNAKEWETVAEDEGKSSLEDAKTYVKIKVTKIDGFCGALYKSHILKTVHNTRKIKATVKTVWKYQGRSGSSTKQISIYPGDEENLGCTGWENPAGFDTTYHRTIEAAWFEN